MERENKNKGDNYLKSNPFSCPEGYFDSFEDRLKDRINSENISGRVRIIRLIKPVIGLAASFALIYLLVSVPLKHFFSGVSSTKTQVAESYSIDDSTIKNCLDNLSAKDDSYFYDALNSTTDSIHIDWNKVLPYISSEVDDYEIYAETLNN